MANKKVSKELMERWIDRIQWVQNSSFAIPDSPEEQQQRIARGRVDYAYFVKSYFPHLGTSECGKFQIDAANYLKANTNTRAVFEWARGHAKSSHVSLMIPLWLKIQEPKQINVMVLVSKSADAAKRLLGDLQAELEYNQLFIRDFGTQVKDGNWADGEFKTVDGCLFVALGRGQSPRGLKDRGHRPDYIDMDDIDDDEMCRNPRRVRETTDWCKSALLGTMAMGRGRFVLVGNRIGKTSVLGQMVESEGIHHTKVDALNAKGQPSWPEFYTLVEITSIRKFMTERLFQKEYMNNPINEGTVFVKKNIRYGKMLDLKYYKTLICYTDPSFKSSATADFKATVLVGKTPTGEYHVIKCFADQTSTSQMVQWHYSISNFINYRVPALYYMESNFLQDLLLEEFKTVGKQVGHQIPIRGDTRKKEDKFARIEAGLQPIFQRNEVIFNEDEKTSDGMKVLEEQLLLFEKGSNAHDDAPDALEGAIFLLNKRTRSSDATYAFGTRESRKF